MQISRGKIQGAQKVVIYGPEGIGKSTFASQFPNALFSDTEGSTKHMDVARLDKPTSWTMLLQEIQYVKANPTICDTYIIDTVDWAEQLCKIYVCSKANKDGIEEFGYGKGYTYLAEEFGKFLNQLTELIDLGINVVLVAHAAMRKFEQPDEMGAYDRWEMKLEKKVAALVKEWTDMLLFANYKTLVVNVDNQGAAKGKNKAQGGKRVMYTSHHPCWDAKNRHDLQDEIPFEYTSIQHCIPARTTTPVVPVVAPLPITKPAPEPVSKPVQEPAQPTPETKSPEQPPAILENVPKPLADLMTTSGVTVEEIQKAVAHKGYYPIDTPIDKYDPGFINGVLVGAWPQVFKMIQDIRITEEIF